MKALVWKGYGGPEQLVYGEAEVPEPRPGEIRVRIRATGLNAADLHLLQADPFLVRLATGLVRPKYLTLGADVAGVVDALGPGVTRWKIGDAVFGDLSAENWGGLAEFVCAPEAAWSAKPADLSFEHAAALPMASVTAYQALVVQGKVQPGHHVLVHGASGGVGTWSVQIAKCLGARVTAVCSSRNADLVRSLGADRVIDYTREDFLNSGDLYDVIHAANGDRPLKDYARALAAKGTYVMTGGSLRQMFAALLVGPWKSRNGQRFVGMTAKPNLTHTQWITEQVVAGGLRPVIDRTVALAEGAQAFAYLAEGHAQGKVVVTLGT